MTKGKLTKSLWSVYIIETERNTLYTGITNNVEKRWLTHKQGRGAKYLKANKPRCLVYVESLENRSLASKREAEIKKLERSKKLVLIDSHRKQLLKFLDIYNVV